MLRYVKSLTDTTVVTGKKRQERSEECEQEI